MNPDDAVEVPGISPHWSPDLLDLNHRLLEEISNVQLRMVDVLRENFQLKTDLELTREALHAAEDSRKYKVVNNVPSSKTKNARYVHDYELTDARINEVVAKSYLPIPLTAEDLKRSVDDMIHLVDDLNAKAPSEDEPAIREALNPSPYHTALPPPSYLEKGGGWWPGSSRPTVDDLVQTEKVAIKSIGSSNASSDDLPLSYVPKSTPLAPKSSQYESQESPVPPPVIIAPARSAGRKDAPGAISKVEKEDEPECRISSTPSSSKLSANFPNRMVVRSQASLPPSLPSNASSLRSNHSKQRSSIQPSSRSDTDDAGASSSATEKTVPDEL